MNELNTSGRERLPANKDEMMPTRQANNFALTGENAAYRSDPDDERNSVLLVPGRTAPAAAIALGAGQQDDDEHDDGFPDDDDRDEEADFDEDDDDDEDDDESEADDEDEEDNDDGRIASSLIFRENALSRR